VKEMSEDTARSAADVVFVDSEGRVKNHAIDERKVVGMQGQYTLKNWRDADGNPRVFSCRVLKMTPQAIEITAPVTGNIGEWLEVHFSTLGKFEGPIIRTGSRALVMRIVTTAEDRNKVAGKIAWIENKNTPDARRHKRFTPSNPDSAVRQSNGAVVPCQIIDYSISGAGVISDLDPPIGTVIKLGTVIGRVVRRFNGGFAVEFAVLQEGQPIERLLQHRS
jgi:PilZ domain-containing protein